MPAPRCRLRPHNVWSLFAARSLRLECKAQTDFGLVSRRDVARPFKRRAVPADEAYLGRNLQSQIVQEAQPKAHHASDLIGVRGRRGNLGVACAAVRIIYVGAGSNASYMPVFGPCHSVQVAQESVRSQG